MTNGDPNTYAKAKALSASINGGEPMAWKEYPDGSMVIVTENGQKFTFSPDEKPEPKFELAEELETPLPEVQEPKKKGKRK